MGDNLNKVYETNDPFGYRLHTNTRNGKQTYQIDVKHRKQTIIKSRKVSNIRRREFKNGRWETVEPRRRLAEECSQSMADGAWFTRSTAFTIFLGLLLVFAFLLLPTILRAFTGTKDEAEYYEAFPVDPKLGYCPGLAGDIV